MKTEGIEMEMNKKLNTNIHLLSIVSVLKSLKARL
jgi:hypothetical protein